MKAIRFNGKSYEVDDRFFLVDFKQWDEDFAEAMAKRLELGN